MNSLIKKQELVSRDILKKVVEKKIAMNVKAEDICKGLNIDEDTVFRYFAGEDINNLPLGIKILDYLEQQEIKKEKL